MRESSLTAPTSSEQEREKRAKGLQTELAKEEEVSEVGLSLMMP